MLSSQNLVLGISMLCVVSPGAVGQPTDLLSTTIDSDVPDTPIFKATGHLVQADFIVLDKNQGFVPNLDESLFRVYEDGRKQDPKLQGRRAPFNLAIAVDPYCSFQMYQDLVKSAVTGFVARLEPHDRFAIFNYGGPPPPGLARTTQDFGKQLKDVLWRGGSVSIEQGIDKALRLFQKEVPGERNALIIITEAFSPVAITSNTLSKLRQANVMIFVLHVDGSATTTPNSENLRTLSKLTNGTYFRVTAMADLVLAWDMLYRRLMSMYRVFYTPSNTLYEGRHRTLQVEIAGHHNDYHVEGRTGFDVEQTETIENQNDREIDLRAVRSLPPTTQLRELKRGALILVETKLWSNSPNGEFEQPFAYYKGQNQLFVHGDPSKAIQTGGGCALIAQGSSSKGFEVSRGHTWLLSKLFKYNQGNGTITWEMQSSTNPSSTFRAMCALEPKRISEVGAVLAGFGNRITFLQ